MASSNKISEIIRSYGGEELLKSLGITGDYEGIGHCVLGYVDGDYPAIKERRENTTFWIE